LVTANAATRLLQHYVDNYRQLPWRSPPGSTAPDPYAVWLSEIMLQQTTVAAVVPRFERFLARWPSVDALAAAKDEEILGEWAGLGYYARARNLIACARVVARQGAFPNTEAGLRDLPGVGAYTAAAIAAIAFGEPAAAIDTNVERLIARLKAMKHPVRKEIEGAVMAMLPADRPGDFTQAMMDLGATICRPRAPLCGACPLKMDCRTYANGAPEDYPARKAKRSRPLKYGTAYWTERNGHVWLVRRPEKGMLGGMAALPGSEWTEASSSEEGAVIIGSIRHVFTHFALELAIVSRAEPVSDGWWQPIEDLAEAGLPTLYRRAADLAVAQSQNRASNVRAAA
jgi:A/G-specific adenine glycosylase